MSPAIIPLPFRSDNYCWLLCDSARRTTLAVDPGDAVVVLDFLAREGLSLSTILVTHHHGDHTGGISALKAATGCTVVAHAADAHRIPEHDVLLDDGDWWDGAGWPMQLLATPGHTLGHCVYHLPEQQALFCGDTLFSLGCGRLFEGSAAQMWASLRRLRALPAETQVYCAHEYTESNGRFVLSVDAHNPVLQTRMQEVRQLRAENRPTLPSSLGVECQTNPFLRADAPELANAMGMPGAKPEVVFAALRKAKDTF